MRSGRWAVMLPLLMGAPCIDAEEARVNDFPTVERVLFVDACAREYPDRPHAEMLYKCSCVIDSIASQLSYAEYVDASTAFAAGQVAGERGTQVRESSTGHDLAARYRDARANARKACVMP